MTYPEPESRTMSGPFGDILAVPADRAVALGEIVGKLKGARRVVLTTHVNADGDGAGSEACIAAWLESLGVQVAIVNPTPFPPNLRFLLHRPDLAIDHTDPAGRTAIEEADVCLVLDTSEANRIAPLDQLLDPARTYVVDHHPAGPTVVGRGGVQDPTAAATGELVYDMITLAGDPWRAESARGSYVAIVSDTGSFRFSNTTPRTHAIAADLLTLGIDPEEVFQQLFAVTPPRRIHLLREALARLDHDMEVGLSWIVIPNSVADELGSTAEDFEGLIDYARSIIGTRVAVLFRGMSDTLTKVSFRSTGAIDVNAIARRFGGGGHKKASGASLQGPLARVVPEVLATVRQVLRESA